MADPHWTSYVGMFTGISGAILGFISYWKSTRLKALDLRLELKKALHDFDLEYRQTSELIDAANRSRRAVASATGTFRSGAMDQWNSDLESAKENLAALLNAAPEKGRAYHSLSSEQLENILVDVHRLQAELRIINQKYEQAMKADDEERRQIREDVRNLR